MKLNIERKEIRDLKSLRKEMTAELEHELFIVKDTIAELDFDDPDAGIISEHVENLYSDMGEARTLSRRLQKFSNAIDSLIDDLPEQKEGE